MIIKTSGLIWQIVRDGKWRIIEINLQSHYCRIWIDREISDWNNIENKMTWVWKQMDLQINMFIRSFFIGIRREKTNTKWITTHRWRGWWCSRKEDFFSQEYPIRTTYNRDLSWMECIRNSSIKKKNRIEDKQFVFFEQTIWTFVIVTNIIRWTFWFLNRCSTAMTSRWIMCTSWTTHLQSTQQYSIKIRCLLTCSCRCWLNANGEDVWEIWMRN